MQKGRALGVDVNRVAFGEILDQRNVVRSEAPENVFLAANGAEVEAVAVNVADFTEPAGGDFLFELDDRRMIEQHVADHQRALVFRRDTEQIARVVGNERDRLFHQRVLAVLQALFGDFIMRHRRRGDDDAVDLLILQHLLQVRGEGNGAGNFFNRFLRAGAGVANQLQVAGQQLLRGADVVLSPLAAADDG